MSDHAWKAHQDRIDAAEGKVKLARRKEIMATMAATVYGAVVNRALNIGECVDVAARILDELDKRYPT